MHSSEGSLKECRRDDSRLGLNNAHLLGEDDCTFSQEHYVVKEVVGLPLRLQQAHAHRALPGHDKNSSESTAPQVCLIETSGLDQRQQRR